jgi:hypothetical protein
VTRGERAPNGFDRLADVISDAEVEEISNRNKQIAGFDREWLNRQGSPLGRV